MNKKYEILKDSFLNISDRKLFKIRALKDFGDVKKGDLGGYVETEYNLITTGDAWVSDDARVFGNARVYGNAQVSGDAWVSGKAQVYGNAKVYGDAQVSGNARVSDDARVSGDAWVFNNKLEKENKNV